MFVTSTLPRPRPVMTASPAGTHAQVMFSGNDKKKKAAQAKPADSAAPVETPKADSSKSETEPADEFNWERLSDPGDAEPPEEVQPPKTGEYMEWRNMQERAELEAIGRRFATPGRVINEVENRTKAVTRKLTTQTGDLVTSIRNSVCQTAASVLRKSARTIESWQASSGSPE